jgi:hypothetical protein
MGFVQRACALAAAALALTIVSCGGDDACCDDLESYFKRFDQIDNERRAAFQELDREIDETFAGQTGLTGENRDELAAAYGRGEAILNGVVEDLQEMTPPPEAEALHEEAIDGFREFRQSFAILRVRVPNILTVQDAVEAFAGQSDPGGRAARACDALQKLADDSGIEVTLDCGGPGE